MEVGDVWKVDKRCGPKFPMIPDNGGPHGFSEIPKFVLDYCF